MKKIALVAFTGEAMCFQHALLNALDMQAKGHDVKLVIEGSATKQIALMTGSGGLAQLYERVREAGLIDCACKACAAKMGSLEAAEEQGLQLRGEMSGHPSLATYLEAGYELVVM